MDAVTVGKSTIIVIIVKVFRDLVEKTCCESRLHFFNAQQHLDERVAADLLVDSLCILVDKNREGH